MPLKRGRLSRAEQDHIRKHAASQSAEQIAARLRREPGTIKIYIRDHLPQAPHVPNPDSERSLIRQELRNSIAWQNLKDEFLPKELSLFEERYVALIEQFREDVLATEENQIMKAIKYEILMSRNLKQRQRALTDIERLERMSTEFWAAVEGRELTEPERQQAMEMETALQAARAAETAKTTEYVKLEEKHQALMKDLKATRDQRLSRVESGKETFLAVLKRLADEDEAERVGRQMELMRHATEKEFRRLSSPLLYEDGRKDAPLLCAESLTSPEEDE
jgi:hypothetical protein